MKNIVLIGMPGTGKSVVGRALAERLRYDFVDVDDLIVEAAGEKTLADVLRKRGVNDFLSLESEVAGTLDKENTVIATGGSVVLSDKATVLPSPTAMQHLSENGGPVWLETPLSQISERMPDDLADRPIAAPANMTLRDIYEEREGLYAKYADLIVASREGEHATAQQVEEVMRTVGVCL